MPAEEKDANATRDLKKILKRYYGVELKTYYSYFHKCSINTEKILELLIDGLLPQKYLEKIKKKLMKAYERRGLPWTLTELYKAFKRESFLVSEASKVLQKAKSHTREKLMELQKKDYLTSTKTKVITNGAGTPVRRVFRITNKALRIIKLLHPLFPSTPFTLSNSGLKKMRLQVIQIMRKPMSKTYSSEE